MVCIPRFGCSIGIYGPSTIYDNRRRKSTYNLKHYSAFNLNYRNHFHGCSFFSFTKNSEYRVRNV